MRQITFKTNNNELIVFNSNITTFGLDQEQPYGVDYRADCSTTLTESEVDEWWNYVDQLLLENPIFNFHSVWRIVDGNNLYGYEN